MGRWLTFCTIICFVTFVLDKSEANDEYRLPTTVTPSEYTVDLELSSGIFTGNVTTFDGSSKVLFIVTSTTSSVVIHASVDFKTLVLTAPNGTALGTNYTTNSTTELVTITVGEDLIANATYTLTSTYTGKLDLVEMRGFYRSEYIDENNETSYLVTTQFQATNARKAFPCFDEPRYKAKFTISITYPSGLLALSNTVRENTTTVDSTYEKATFAQTPVMPTYLIAFIVSAFNCTEGEPIDTNVTHSVCSSKGSVDDRGLAVKYGPQIMQAIEGMVGLKYKAQGLGKMHQVAIPDFSAGAMENWGLVTYRESALLWNEVASSSSYKERILTVIAHEFAHMWFGNLVTCDWWDYTFLNEGFARYFQYFAITKIPDLDVNQVWDMAKKFIIEQQQVVFTYDSSRNSKSLTSESFTPSEVSNKFSSISYNKGASIIRMIENIMGSTNFFRGLTNYLNANSYSTAVPNSLWSSLEEQIPSGILPENVALTTVLENWVNASGFPVVRATVRGNNVIIRQNRFVYNSSDEIFTQYYVPISYAISNMSNPFDSVTPQHWLLPDGSILLDQLLQYNDWIILNNQQSAYYRVNYDTVLWQRIMNVLNSDHTIIHVMNRAQIVDDAFNLARADDHLKFDQALRIVSYLKNETEYYPWYPAISGFGFLQRLYGQNSETGQKLATFELELLEGVLNDVSFIKLNESNHIYSLKVNMILGRACKLGNTGCVQTALTLFKDFKSGISIDKNLRTIVYCNGIRHSSDIVSDWTFLWDKFKVEKLATEKLTMMSALGCTSNVTQIKYFLNQTLYPESTIKQQDISSAWSGVYTANTQNVATALEFFLDNFVKINEYYPSATSILSNIASTITTSEELQLLENVVASAVPEKLQTAVTAAISTAQLNMQWASNKKTEIDEYFNPTTTTTSPTTEVTVPLPTTLCSTSSPVTAVAPTTPSGNSARMLKSITTLSTFAVVLLSFALFV